MAMYCLPDVSTKQVDGNTEVVVTCDPLDLTERVERAVTARVPTN